MKRSMYPRAAAPLRMFIALLLLFGIGTQSALAQSETETEARLKPRWLFQTSLYTRHFNPDPRHVNHQRMLAFEHWSTENWVYGASFQRNSFGQQTQYVFIGKTWRPFDSVPVFHIKLTGGLLHGYKGEFRDKIPLNKYGVAPGLVPSIGISTRRFAVEAHLLGAAAMMVSAGVFWE